MDIDKDVISLIVKEVLMQTGQQGTQQTSQQIGEAIQQALQKVQGSSQEKASSLERNAMSENKFEEINTGEAFRSNVYTQTRVHDFNMKMLTAKELEFDLALKALQLKDKELEIARKQHDFSHAQKLDMQNLSIKQYLDALSVARAENSQNFDMAIKFEYAKFNSAVSEPISPDSGADSKDAKK